MDAGRDGNEQSASRQRQARKWRRRINEEMAKEVEGSDRERDKAELRKKPIGREKAEMRRNKKGRKNLRIQERTKERQRLTKHLRRKKRRGNRGR